MCTGELITGVALLSAEGKMWSLPRPNRHHNLFALAAFQNADASGCTQGFTTSTGRFVDREQAFEMTRTNGQPNRRSGNPGSKQLYSEDLW